MDRMIRDRKRSATRLQKKTIPMPRQWAISLLVLACWMPMGRILCACQITVKENPFPSIKIEKAIKKSYL